MQLQDVEAAARKFEREIKSGTAALVLLGVISSARQPMYGYQITRIIDERAHAGDEPGPRFKQGALYPVLRSLERSGALESSVEPSVAGPPRRYYSITSAGEEVLGRWTLIWDATRDLVDDILKGNDDV
jgi:PadR family transcriptional regulator PadR